MRLIVATLSALGLMILVGCLSLLGLLAQLVGPWILVPVIVMIALGVLCLRGLAYGLFGGGQPDVVVIQNPGADARPSAETSTSDRLLRLQQLGDLRDQGVLTEDEFVREKTALLRSGL